jgi:hypothetical protein
LSHVPLECAQELPAFVVLIESPYTQRDRRRHSNEIEVEAHHANEVPCKRGAGAESTNVDSRNKAPTIVATKGDLATRAEDWIYPRLAFAEECRIEEGDLQGHCRHADSDQGLKAPGGAIRVVPEVSLTEEIVRGQELEVTDVHLEIQQATWRE